MPYSCHDQFGMSGCSTTPVGAGSTWRAMGRIISQTSRFRIGQTTSFVSPPKLSGGRSMIAEYSILSSGRVVIRASLAHHMQERDKTFQTFHHQSSYLIIKKYGDNI